MTWQYDKMMPQHGCTQHRVAERMAHHNRTAQHVHHKTMHCNTAHGMALHGMARTFTFGAVRHLKHVNGAKVAKITYDVFVFTML